MAYKRAADGVARKGKTQVDVMPNDGKHLGIEKGGKGGKGGKSNEDMKSMGRNLAKLAAQKRG